MSEKIKLCPVCGCDARVRKYRTYVENAMTNKYYVQCKRCQAEVPQLGFLSMDEAIEAWNAQDGEL